MGILNATPDSFHEESRTLNLEKAVEKARQMISDGATILDIGGQSTRPGSEAVGPETEMERVIPVIRAIHEAFPEVIISIDTYYATVASKAVEAGASIINDISAGIFDPAMLETAANFKVPYILMHHQGTLEGMHQAMVSNDITLSIMDFLLSESMPASRPASKT